MENEKEIGSTQEKEPLTKEQAEAEIGVLMQEVYLMGANDYEIPAIQKILKDLKEDKVDPTVALEEAHRIKASKQDYH